MSTAVVTSAAPPAPSWWRQAIVLLAVLGIGATVAELAMLKHWNGFEQMIPWISLGIATVALVLVAGAVPSRSALRVARVLVAVTALSAIIGIYEHVHSNYESAPLDAVYGPKWDTMSAVSRWWAALTAQVGPSPTIVPGVLAYVALMIFLLTLRPSPSAAAVSSPV